MRLLYPFLLLVLFSCGRKDQLPANVLPREKMQPVLWDVLRAEELVNFYIPRDSSWNTLAKRAALYQDIFHIHKVTKDQFVNSIRFYQSRPDLFKIILDSLAKKQQALPVPKPLNREFKDTSRTSDTTTVAN
jgi:hypothetical protein